MQSKIFIEKSNFVLFLNGDKSRRIVDFQERGGLDKRKGPRGWGEGEKHEIAVNGGGGGYATFKL